MTIITRVGFCPLCALSNAPKTGQHFLAYGSTSKAYHVMEAENFGRIGFVPHIYKGKINGANVIVEISCAMYPCGADRQKEETGLFYFIKQWRREIWTIERWNSLVIYKHDQQYEI